MKTLKRQAEDIDTLLQYMSRQFVEMQGAYREELEEIESAFLQVCASCRGPLPAPISAEGIKQCAFYTCCVPWPTCITPPSLPCRFPWPTCVIPSPSFAAPHTQERTDLLGSNRNEMQELFDKRSKMEQDFMERFLGTVETYQKTLEALRIADAEDYHILKIRLETDIQNLEQHLEAMRATYQLNTEKLDYNYRVLVERDHENQATINQQKRKISRQRDVLSGLKQRYSETEKK